MRVIIIISLILFTSCFNNSNKEVKSTESKVSIKEIEDYGYKFADIELARNDEKILLLSIIKNIPYEKTYSVLRDYHAKTDSFVLYNLRDEIKKLDYEYTIAVIDTISIKHSLSKKEVASILFSYKYELLTPEDIYNKYSDEIIENYLNGQDAY